MPPYRHITAIAKPGKDLLGHDIMEMCIVHQTHLGKDFAGDAFIDENGDEVEFDLFPFEEGQSSVGSVELMCDGGIPEYSKIANGVCRLYCWGYASETRHFTIKIPIDKWPEVKKLIEDYNEYFKGE